MSHTPMVAYSWVVYLGNLNRQAKIRLITILMQEANTWALASYGMNYSYGIRQAVMQGSISLG
ncbi:protein of unknown function [Pseudomonas inefficax]|uniref:Uncharacterized protein n=1 Tax=Pseudomonas inefficax TaxID=2078786 RepID=A0AAQ1PB70_9PSED|nr:protein of unknown function [Pseudomonas inefficax]